MNRAPRAAQSAGPSAVRSAARSAARRAVKAAARAYDRLRPPDPGLVVLIYHRVGATTPTVVDLPEALFADQVAELSESGRIVSLDQGIAHASAGTWPPGHPGGPMVAVTFDDGTADFADRAMPILAKHRVPSTLYVATRHVDEQAPFPDAGSPLSWGALADVASTGLVSVGSHTHGHLLLDRAPIDEVRRDLDRSIGLIGERLGSAPAHFAYPKAVLGSPAAQAEVRRRFASAAVAGTRANPVGPGFDAYRIARSPLQTSDAMAGFRLKAAGGMRLEDDLRRAANLVRYRNATS